MNFNTKVIHGGQHHESATGSVNVPVFLTSTFAQKVPEYIPDMNIQELPTLQDRHWKTLWQVLKTEREVWLSVQVLQQLTVF